MESGGSLGGASGEYPWWPTDTTLGAQAAELFTRRGGAAQPRCLWLEDCAQKSLERRQQAAIGREAPGAVPLPNRHHAASSD